VNKDVLELAVAYKHELKKYKRKFSFPRSSDITKTYQYRHLVSFMRNCKKRGLNLEESKDVIRVIVKYASEKNMSNRGISILNCGDVIEICCKIWEQEVSDVQSVLDALVYINDSLPPILKKRYDYLLKKPKRKGYTKMSMMYNAGELTDYFIAISKSASRALTSLPEDERELFKKKPKYFVLRNKLINKIGYDELRTVMGMDFNG